MTIQLEAVAGGNKTLVEETIETKAADNAMIPETMEAVAIAIKVEVSATIQETRVAAIATKAEDSRNAINIP